MKVKVIVEDERGNKYQGEVVLNQIQAQPTGGEIIAVPSSIHPAAQLTFDFTLNERTFAKRYGAEMGGPKIFTLLVAYLAKGDPKKQVSCVDVERLWNSMTSIFRVSFNRKYPTKAKEDGWVDSKSRGSYSLTEDWQGILEKFALAQ